MSGQDKLISENVKVDKVNDGKKPVEKKTTEKIPCEVCDKPYAKSYMKSHIKKEHENKSMPDIEVIQVEVEVMREQEVETTYEEKSEKEENKEVKEDNDVVIKNDDDEKVEQEMREILDDYELGEEASRMSQELKEKDNLEKKALKPDAEFLLSTQTGLEMQEMFDNLDMDNMLDDSRDTNIELEVIDNKEADEDVANIIGEVLKETEKRVELEDETVYHSFARNEDMTRQCQHCDQRFAWLVDLTSHMMREHEPFKKVDMPADPVPYLFGEMMSELGEEMEGIRHKTEKFQKDITRQLNFQTQTLKQDLLKEIGKMLKPKPETGEPNEPANKPTPDMMKKVACYGCEENMGNRTQHFHCVECGKFFDKGKILSKHIQNEHINEIKAVCEKHKCKDLTRKKDEEIKRLKAVIEDNAKVIHDTLEENKTLNDQNTMRRCLEGEIEPTENPEEPEQTDKEQEETRQVRCTKCNFVTTKVNILKDHVTKRHMSTCIVCPKCLEEFNSQQTLNSHMKKEHAKIENLPMGHPERSRRKNQLDMTNNFMCPYCPEEFQTKKDLRDHIYSNHNRDDDGYECTECKTVFQTKKDLRDHINSNHKRDDDGYECTECKTVFQTKKYLRDHINSNHNSDDDGYECTKCKKMFKTTEEYQEHVKNEHEEFQKDTPICKYYKQGRCTRQPCNFRHPKKYQKYQQLQQQQSHPHQQQNQNPQQHEWLPACRRGPACAYLAQGKCHFFHSAWTQQQKPHTQKTQRQMCVWLEDCRRVPNCPFLHSVADFPPLMKNQRQS